MFSFNSKNFKVFSPNTDTIKFYELGLNNIYVKSFSYRPWIFTCASHFPLSGFQNARTASPFEFLFVNDAKCFVSLFAEKAKLTQLLKEKLSVYSIFLLFADAFSS